MLRDPYVRGITEPYVQLKLLLWSPVIEPIPFHDLLFPAKLPSEAIILFLFLHDGSKLEIPQCEEVAHKPGGLFCLDYLGAPIASFLDEDVLGYSLNPETLTPEAKPGDQEGEV